MTLILRHEGLNEDRYTGKCTCGAKWAVEEYSEYDDSE